MGRFQSLFGRPEFLRAFHGWMTLAWGALIPITIFTGLKGSIIWIALMSVWANFVGHFSSWQAARVEVKQDEQVDEALTTASDPTSRQPLTAQGT
ncbi:MAG: hypothetical protein JWL79_2311 [Frankiales bacterium]|jgi:hypothetical protein|nr:hypothetical protein [Frankiales bacterium]